MHKVIYSYHAREDLLGFERKIAQRIIKKILFFSLQQDPVSFAKKLTNPGLGQYRFRIGDYRALFDIDSRGKIQILMILRVKHRKDIYNL